MIEIITPQSAELNFRQRWASYLTIAVAVVGLLGGVLLRSSIIDATVRFENKQAGIAVRYPVNWLLDENREDFVLRVEDPAATPFKTMLQISIVPIGQGARSALDILNPLNISRATSLPSYRTLEISPIRLPNGTSATQMLYAYAASEANPILQSIPIVVRAIDVVVLRSSQAVIITYRADAESFERNQHYFEAFLRSLEF
jgi:hypothetical protein